MEGAVGGLDYDCCGKRKRGEWGVSWLMENKFIEGKEKIKEGGEGRIEEGGTARFKA